MFIEKYQYYPLKFRSLRSFPENPQFYPNMLGQQALISHKMENYCITSVIQLGVI